MGTLQKWLTGLIGLGALYLVVTNPSGFSSAASGINRIVGGTETTIITGGKKGGA
jgi:hypothetical protein